jgi:hypothetical protein
VSTGAELASTVLNDDVDAKAATSAAKVIFFLSCCSMEVVVLLVTLSL